MDNSKKIADIVVHNDKEIKGFFYKYRWLSNFHLCQVTGSSLTYPSSENAYQAAKFPPNERHQFLDISPVAAKKLGQNGKLYTKEEWETKKIIVMKAVTYHKYHQNEDLRKMLLDTEDKYLEETNWWGDIFYGVYNGVGNNWLGKILMDERRNIKFLMEHK